MLTYSYTALWFLYPFFAGYYTNITVSSCNTKRISSLEKSLSEKYVHIPRHIPGCQKNGAFHIGIQKNRAIHIPFVEKGGPIIYLAVLKKGAIRHAHPYYVIKLRNVYTCNIEIPRKGHSYGSQSTIPRHKIDEPRHEKNALRTSRRINGSMRMPGPLAKTHV